MRLRRAIVFGKKAKKLLLTISVFIGAVIIGTNPTYEFILGVAVALGFILLFIYKIKE